MTTSPKMNPPSSIGKLESPPPGSQNRNRPSRPRLSNPDRPNTKKRHRTSWMTTFSVLSMCPPCRPILNHRSRPPPRQTSSTWASASNPHHLPKNQRLPTTILSTFSASTSVAQNQSKPRLPTTADSVEICSASAFPPHPHSQLSTNRLPTTSSVEVI